MILHVYDPWANPAIARYEYGIDITNELPAEKFDAVILAVAHNEFEKIDIIEQLKEQHVVFDVKGGVNRKLVDGRL